MDAAESDRSCPCCDTSAHQKIHFSRDCHMIHAHAVVHCQLSLVMAHFFHRCEMAVVPIYFLINVFMAYNYSSPTWEVGADVILWKDP